MLSRSRTAGTLRPGWNVTRLSRMKLVIDMLKRIFTSLLALAWVLALSACSGPDLSAVLPPAETASLPVSTQEPSNPVQTPPPSGPEQAPSQTPEAQPSESAAPAVSEDGRYNTKEEVALYIHLYGHLPDNYLTKREAQDKGWTGGSVERCAGEGAAIGGSRFGNYEGLLPEEEGRTYTECDIDTVGSSSRGAKRIVFSNDGLIYYTGDHYESFELLYGEP